MASRAEPAPAGPQAARGQQSSSSAGCSSEKSSFVHDGPFKDITRDNGVSFQAQESISIQGYIESFVRQLPAKNVVSASRISNGRIALYLNSKQAVIEAVQKGLDHNGTYYELMPLVKPTTKMTLSNVYPEIPNSVLRTNLSSFCKIVSKIRPIPLGFKNRELSHVMSFRRQVQVLIPENVTPPDNMNINYAGNNYRIFLTTESARCFKCGELGHIGRACKKEDPTPNNGAPKRPPPPPTNQNDRHSSPNPEEKQPKANEKPLVRPPTTQEAHNPEKKGNGSNQAEMAATARSPITVVGDTQSSPVKGTNTKEHSLKSPPPPTRLYSDAVTKRKQSPHIPFALSPRLVPLTSPSPLRKMAKSTCSPMHLSQTPTLSQALNSSTPSLSSPTTANVSDSESIQSEDMRAEDECLTPVSRISTQGPLSPDKLLKFLKSVKSSKKPRTVAQKFTSNIPGLVDQLRTLKNDSLPKKSLQQRLHKLIKNLEF